MRITENQLRRIIRNTITESLDEISPEQQLAVDKEIEMLQSYQGRVEQYPGWRSNSDKEFLQNVQIILESLIDGQYTANDFQPWVEKRFPNYTVPMYKAVYDAVFM